MEKPQVIFEDDTLLIVDKPAGLIVNRADTTKEIETLQDWVEQYLSLKDTLLTSDFYSRSGIVHRLDKDTSGLLIVAKDEMTFLEMQKSFKEKTIQKTYTALTHGKVVPSEGEINVPVGRLPWDRKKFGVVAQGKESRTRYHVKEIRESNEKKKRTFSLVEAYPQTGRTHQIRVHLRYIGFPIVGDQFYAGRKNIQHDKKVISRHFLHAAQLEFVHPVSKQQITVKSQLPVELQNFLSTLTPIVS